MQSKIHIKKLLTPTKLKLNAKHRPKETVCRYTSQLHLTLKIKEETTTLGHYRTRSSKTTKKLTMIKMRTVRFQTEKMQKQTVSIIISNDN